MFPTSVPLATAIALAGFVAGRGYRMWRRPGHETDGRSPYAWPLGLFLVMALLGAWVSPIPDLAFPKLCGIVLGIIACQTVISSVSTTDRLRGALCIYAAVGLAVLAPGLLAVQWADKFPGLAAMTRHVPMWFTTGAREQAAVNANALGGTTLFFLPILIVLIWSGREKPAEPPPGPAGKPRETHDGAATSVKWFAFVGLLAVNVLSQSRSTWIALVVTTFALAFVQWKRARVAMAGVAVASALAAALVGMPGAVRSVASGVVGDVKRAELTRDVRLEIWGTAAEAIGDFPLTGVGLGSFRRIGPMVYPLLRAPGQADIAHAHNIFLQTALDVGIPGLVAYLALLGLATRLCWAVRRDGDRASCAFALGLWGNVLAVHLFGMFDAIAVGSKVGLFFWLNLGLIAALHQCTMTTRGVESRAAAARSEMWTSLTPI